MTIPVDGYPSIVGSLKGNGIKTARYRLGFNPQYREEVIQRLEAIDHKSATHAEFDAVIAIKDEMYRAYNAHLLETLGNIILKGRSPDRLKPAELDIARRAMSLDTSAQHFTFLVKGLENEVHNLRFHDDRITDPEILRRQAQKLKLKKASIS